jgi:3-hydroxyisobutyrate dehydrogenase-like beta-hydroxyacid dehydrogenase
MISTSDQSAANQTPGFIGFGEAGYHLAKGLREAGAGPVSVFDIHWLTPGRGERIRDRAAETGVTLVESPSALAARCDTLLSVVTADRAAEAATQYRPCIGPRHLYVDLNSVSPETKRAIAGQIGVGFVEGAILAPVPPQGLRVPILLNGPAAAEFAIRMAPFGMCLDVMNAGIGAAAAVKMCRSIVVKGLEALLLECVLAATRYGAEDRVFASLDGSFPGIEWRKLAWYMIGRVHEHGGRRAREMEEVARTLRAAGIEPLMAEAAARRQDWRAAMDGTGPANAQELVETLNGSVQGKDEWHRPQ